MPRKIVLASSNAGKLAEFHQAFIQTNVELLPQHQFTAAAVAETGETFIENAILKAREACLASQLPAIADDSGLEVDYLQGAPGVRTARYAGDNATMSDNMQRLWQALAGVPQSKRTAKFRCVIVYLRHAADPAPEIFQGLWQGSILMQPQGSEGFGYDPVFYVPTHDCSAAELSLSEKNRISHRGQAIQALLTYLRRQDTNAAG